MNTTTKVIGLVLVAWIVNGEFEARKLDIMASSPLLMVSQVQHIGSFSGTYITLRNYIKHELVVTGIIPATSYYDRNNINYTYKNEPYVTNAEKVEMLKAALAGDK